MVLVNASQTVRALKFSLNKMTTVESFPKNFSIIVVKLNLPVLNTGDRHFFKHHDVLGQCPRLIAENVLDLSQFLVQIGRFRPGRRVVLFVVHFQVL